MDSYNDLGQIVSVKIGNDNVLSEKHSYDIHGWNKKSEFYNSKVHYTPVFSEELKYADGNTPCYNGNISSVINYRMYEGQAFDYKYDGMDRLVLSQFYKPDDNASISPAIDYSESFEYNENSALTRIRRKGRYYTDSCTEIDDLHLKYDGNLLLRVDDNGRDSYVNGASDFHAYEDEREHFSYNSNGAITRDVTKGVANIEYDLTGMPKRIQFRNGSVTEYVYTADGIKLKTIHRTAVDGISTYSNRVLSDAETLGEDSTLYVDGFEFHNTYDSGKYYYANGYMDCDTCGHCNYNFFAKDHLGNIRAEYNSDGVLNQMNNYYSYGGDLCDFDKKANDAQFHKYNGKELDRMHGLNLYDYSARQYDAALGQFTSMDPLCEKYYHISPYAYCAGNPVKYVDPDGRDAVAVIDEQNKIVRIKANYYVNTKGVYKRGTDKLLCAGYSPQDIKSMNKMISNLNKEGYVISSGACKGFSLQFDMQFVDGGDFMNCSQKATSDYYNTDNGDINIGNVIQRNYETDDVDLSPKLDGSQVGGYTKPYNLIMMNASSDCNGDNLDNNTNRLHELFHTLGFDDMPGSKGIMDYSTLRINQKDIDSILKYIEQMNKQK